LGYRDKGTLSPAELNDVSMQRFRVYAIGALVKAATDTFIEKQELFLRESVAKSLLAQSNGEILRGTLKDFTSRHAYQHRTVLSVELQGHNVIRGLMDIFWAAVVDRKDENNLGSERRNPFTRFVYQAISENYRRVAESPSQDVAQLPTRYRECLLLTDMISGMTDSFAVDLQRELQAAAGDFRVQRFLGELS
jgi:dGTPase